MKPEVPGDTKPGFRSGAEEDLRQDSQLLGRAALPAWLWALRGKLSSFSPAGIDIISTKTKTCVEPTQSSSGEGIGLRGQTLMFQPLFQ